MVVIYITIFDYIALTKYLSDRFVNYTCLVIQKVADEVIIDLDTKDFLIYINIAEGVAK